MRIILIYLLLFTFFVDQVIGAVGLSVKGLSLFNLNLYLLLGFWLILIIKNRILFETNNLNLILILLIVVVVISIPNKISRAEIPNISVLKEIINLKSWLNPILLFFILFNVVDDEKTCNSALVGLGFLFMAVILNQLFAMAGLTNYGSNILSRMGRVGGFGAAGVYAVSLAVFFPLVLSVFFFKRQIYFLKIGSMILGFLILVGLINAGSRNGILCFVCSMGVYFFILKKKNIIGFLPIVLFSMVMMVASISAYLVSSSDVQELVVRRLDMSDNEDLDDFSSGRLGLWESGLVLFKDSPVLGHGQNSFVPLTVMRGLVSGAPHNEYLRYAVEYGIIGLLVFMMVFIKIFLYVSKAIKKTNDPWKKQVYISYLAGLVAFVVGMFFTNIGPARYIFWIYTALVYKYIRLDILKNT